MNREMRIRELWVSFLLTSVAVTLWLLPGGLWTDVPAVLLAVPAWITLANWRRENAEVNDELRRMAGGDDNGR